MRITGPDQCQRPCITERIEKTRPTEPASKEVIVLGERAAKLSDRIAADETEREQRLLELKRKLDDGSYEVDLDRLAERIVDEELAMLGDDR